MESHKEIVALSFRNALNALNNFPKRRSSSYDLVGNVSNTEWFNFMKLT